MITLVVIEVARRLDVVVFFVNTFRYVRPCGLRVMLKPGGRLVAICANGPRQNSILKPLVDAQGGLWEELPPDTFHSSGTSVRTVLMTITA